MLNAVDEWYTSSIVEHGSETREAHIGRVLSALRQVNRLIVRCDDPDALVSETCSTLTRTMGYFNAWIALTEPSGSVRSMFSSGFEDAAALLNDGLLRGEWPACMQRALRNMHCVVVRDPGAECPSCPLAAAYGGRSGFCAALSHGGMVFGVLAVSVPADFAQNDDERRLFEELAGDLGHALFKIATSKQLRETEGRSCEHEQALRQSEHYLRTILDTAVEGFWVLDRDGKIVQVNEAYCRMSGYPHDELIGLGIRDLDAVETPKETGARIERIIAKGSEVFEAVHRRKDGTVFPVEVSVTYARDLGGCFICFCRDLTERNRQQERITLLGRMLDAAPASITIHDGDGRFLFANRATLTLHGYEHESEFLAVNLHDLDVPESEALIAERIRQIEEKGEARFDVAHYRKNGTTIPLEILTKVIDWEGRSAILSVAADTSERKERERELGLAQFSLEHASVAILWVDGIGRIRYANRECVAMVGYDRDELTKMLIWDVDPTLSAERYESIWQEMRGGHPVRFESVQRRKDGVTFPVDVSARQGWFSGESLTFAFINDITERKRAEISVRDSERRYRALVMQSADCLLLHDLEGRIVDVNDSACQTYGYLRDELLRMRISDLDPDYDDRAEGGAFFDRISPGMSVQFEARQQKKTGEIIPVEVRLTRVDLEGQCLIQGLCRDITERKRAEEERQRLQAQLAQAQKLESVGRLAGGVAHDFNNMLGVILGNIDLAIDHLSPSDPLHNDLEEVRKAALRSADLTRQLLAFARKQTIAPKVLDLNETVEAALKMLRRLIGEDIELTWIPRARLWPVKMDPSQVDQILANLCVNSRDAIDGVGKISIETANVALDAVFCEAHPGVPPGDYVVLAVRDNGCGMDDETLSHIYEPFFTTKGVGRGTGLGLATVYGIVKQNGGLVDAESALGLGTTFRIYFPRHGAILDARSEEQPAAEGGSETILLVEDEAEILRMAKRMLTGLGYRVLEATTPTEALRIAGEFPESIDLLVTDVIMPEMNGRDLARNVRRLHPQLKRLFMSGYTADTIAHHGVLDEGVQFIAKPFSRRELAVRVRAALDSK